MPLRKPSEATPVVDAGTYVVKCLDLYDGDEGQYGMMMKWDFEIYDLDGTAATSNFGDTPATMTEISSESMAPSAKARQWAEALLATDCEEMDPADIAQGIIGKYATVAITVNTSGFAKISSMTPVAKRKAAPVPAPVEEELPF